MPYEAISPGRYIICLVSVETAKFSFSLVLFFKSFSMEFSLASNHWMASGDKDVLMSF